MIYVLYGQPGSGKTTLGRLLAEHLDTPFIIDGDEFREMFANKNYGREGREENIRNANAVSTYLNKKGSNCSRGSYSEWKAVYIDVINGWEGRPVNGDTDVVMTLVNPYSHLRDELKVNNPNQVIDVFLNSMRQLRIEFHVEDFEKGKPSCVVNTDRSVEDSWNYLKLILDL